ncbi:hypothetical protein PAPYR_5352 [Paratrimastix pyriformis]|uniref:F-box domain-containing protein n=1 Tax=Paratrimastix pyriformis TaxID=342808 RepID=A0ABQ8UHX4_9EUKA|nr:hypothetical protein PAPYR_5352 [Paratrimastix pyriformis]
MTVYRVAPNGRDCAGLSDLDGIAVAITQTDRMALDDLPGEILLQIFGAFDSALDILRLSHVCHRFRYAVQFLTSLDLDATPFTLDQLVEILFKFPNLRHLALRVSSEDAPLHRHNIAHLPPSLEVLTLDGWTLNPGFAPVLLRTLPHLNTLKLARCHGRGIRTLLFYDGVPLPRPAPPPGHPDGEPPPPPAQPPAQPQLPLRRHDRPAEVIDPEVEYAEGASSDEDAEDEADRERKREMDLYRDEPHDGDSGGEEEPFTAAPAAPHPPRVPSPTADAVSNPTQTSTAAAPGPSGPIAHPAPETQPPPAHSLPEAAQPSMPVEAATASEPAPPPLGAELESISLEDCDEIGATDMGYLPVLHTLAVSPAEPPIRPPKADDVHFHMGGAHQRAPGFLVALAVPTLRSLTMSGLAADRALPYDMLGIKFPALEALRVEGCDLGTFTAASHTLRELHIGLNPRLAEIHLRCPELRVLDVSGCPALPSESLTELAHECPELECLTARWCAFRKVTLSLGALRTLDLRSAPCPRLPRNP